MTENLRPGHYARLLNRRLLILAFGLVVMAGVLFLRRPADVAEVGCGVAAATESCDVSPQNANGDDANWQGYDGLVSSVDESGPSIAFTLGDPEAPVTLTEFSDFTCHTCHDLSYTLRRIIGEYVRAGTVRLVYKPVSLVTPGYSARSAVAAYCTARQGLVWEMSEQLWAEFAIGGPESYTEEAIPAIAGKVQGLDTTAFEACFSERASYDTVYKVNAEARARDVAVTPIVFINDRRISLKQDIPFYDTLTSEIETELNKKTTSGS